VRGVRVERRRVGGEDRRREDRGDETTNAKNNKIRKIQKIQKIPKFQRNAKRKFTRKKMKLTVRRALLQRKLREGEGTYGIRHCVDCLGFHTRQRRRSRSQQRAVVLLTKGEWGRAREYVCVCVRERGREGGRERRGELTLVLVAGLGLVVLSVDEEKRRDERNEKRKGRGEANYVRKRQSGKNEQGLRTGVLGGERKNRASVERQ
jgi:hypothetical protein